VAVVDHMQPRVTEIMQRLAAAGVRGFRLYADKMRADEWAGLAGMKAMWAFAAEQGLALCPLANPDALPAIRDMCQQFTDTRVVIDHCARVGGKGTIVQADLDELCGLA
jgi:predicted TIM-barrel fold metal-dependent hydrolase